MTHPYLRGDAPRILAHRGFVPADSEGIVENSFAAVAAAHALGIEYVESDCHLSADGTVILFHDDDLSRVTGDPRSLSTVADRELEELMSERGGLITLEQALTAFPTLRFNLDVKADAAAEPVGRIVAAHAHRVLVTSFSDRRRRRALAAARAAGAHPATAPGRARTIGILLAVRSGLRPLVRWAFSGLDALQVPERQGPIHVVTAPLVRAAHDNGVEVHVWTVNAADDMKRLLALGVDGLVTDRSDRARQVLGLRT